MGKTQFAEKGQTRKENVHFRVLVTPEERAQIIATAKTCHLSVSALLRNLGVGYAPASWLDTEAVENLRQAVAEQGRLGGLLKMWLTDRKEYDKAIQWTMRKLSEELTASQKEIREIVAVVLADTRRKKSVSHNF
ncbi:conjugal transfer relaxosome component TraJ [Planctomycetales bacterium]|nr:conjugal transfer relaxosome component TraJ [Planctomycetales bacterium]GHS99204.1 conjugal transfer relaxosome component TraJ [Planctomycetales bacterium]GHT03626.1 conjugal transfer relaxosome component TraJ [Planctomycetales bacterium]